MSAFPLLPRYSKMIILGQQFGNMPYVIAIVAGLSVGDPFLSIDELEGLYKDKQVAAGSPPAVVDEVLRSKRRKYTESREQFSALDPGCDVISLLCAIGAYECAGASDIFCEENFLRVKTMRDIQRLRIQITNLINNQLAGVIAPVVFSPNLTPPSPLQIRTLKQVVTAAYLDQIAIRLDLVEANISKRKTSDPLRAKYLPLTSPVGHLKESTRREVYIHPNSALAKLATAPDYIIYSNLRESQNYDRLRLLPLTTVTTRDIEPLARGTPFIQYSKPLNYPPPRVFSEGGVMKKEIYVVPRFGIEGRGWELPSIKRVETLSKY
jgi:ATP-dependent RNA helicase DHX37/DHR1